jgi:hypothetical protein
MLAEKTDPAPWQYPLVEDTWFELPRPGGSYISDWTFYYRLERSGGELTALWSQDNLTWNTAFSRDMGSQLNGLTQTVVITGLSWFNPAGSYADWDYVTVTPTVVPVDIDIKPGSEPNAINAGSNGLIPVAILTTDSFQATTVDPSSVRFGASSDTEAHGTGHIEDVDHDGDLDMVLHFGTKRSGIKCGDTEATLTGSAGGRSIVGTDSIVTVDCS